MDPLAATLAAFQAVEDALGVELAHTLGARVHLRALAPAELAHRLAQRQAFDRQLGPLLDRAKAELAALRARGLSEAAPVADALASARRAAHRLQEADALDRGVAERALAVVRALSRRAAAPAAAYGPRGAPTELARATTTRRTA